jgi:hypothetical protein
MSPLGSGDREDEGTPYHELVPAAGEESFEPKAAQARDEDSALRRALPRHQLALRILPVAPSSVGTSRPRATRTRGHSSTTSARFRRQASSVVPVATTLRRPRTVAANVPSGISS